MGQVVELLPHHNVTSLKVVAFWVELGDLDKPSKPSVFAVSAGGFFCSGVEPQKSWKERPLSRVVNPTHLHFHTKASRRE